MLDITEGREVDVFPQILRMNAQERELLIHIYYHLEDGTNLVPIDTRKMEARIAEQYKRGKMSLTRKGILRRKSLRLYMVNPEFMPPKQKDQYEVRDAWDELG